MEEKWLREAAEKRRAYTDFLNGDKVFKANSISEFSHLLQMPSEPKVAGILSAYGFFFVESGARKQDYFYSNGNAGVAVRKFEYDAVYDMFANRGSALFNEYEVGTVIEVGGKEYAMNADRKFDIPYGEDIFDIQFPQRSADI